MIVFRCLVVVVLVAFATACSATTSSAPASAPVAAPPPSVEDAVRSYNGAFVSGQGEKAAAMLSTRCNTPALQSQIIEAAKMTPALYGQARLVSITPTIDGDRATVTYRFD